jgi:hypothetical protein
VNKELLELDKKEVLYLQTIDDPVILREEERKAAIEFNGRTPFSITWKKSEKR